MKHRPFPWRCFFCGEYEVHPETVPHDCKVRWNGELHDVHVPAYTQYRCHKCGEIIVDRVAEDQVTAAMESMGMKPDDRNAGNSGI